MNARRETTSQPRSPDSTNHGTQQVITTTPAQQSMSPPAASAADRPPQQVDQAGAAAAGAATRAPPSPLGEVLVTLRLWGAPGHDNNHCDKVQVGDCWDLGQGLGLVLLTKPSTSSTHHTPSPARCVFVCVCVLSFVGFCLLLWFLMGSVRATQMHA